MIAKIAKTTYETYKTFSKDAISASLFIFPEYFLKTMIIITTDASKDKYDNIATTSTISRGNISAKRA